MNQRYITLDAAKPSRKSIKYTGPFMVEGKPEIRAIVYDPSNGKCSPETQELFDIARKNWHIVGVADENSAVLLDGLPSTAWHHGSQKSLQLDLVID